MRTLLILLLSIGLVSAEEARGVEGFVSMMTGQGWKLEEGSGCRGEGGVKMLVFTRGNDERLDAAAVMAEDVEDAVQAGSTYGDVALLVPLQPDVGDSP